MKKYSSQRGESLVESLAAMLIISMSSLILSGAVVSAARVNSRLKNEDVAFTLTENALDPNYTVTITVPEADGTETIEVETAALYKTSKGYYYYELSSNS